MNLGFLDWLIIAGFAGLVTGSALVSRPLMRGVADFLAAGRTAGRYVLTVSQGIAALGAITVVGMLEMNYVAGFQQTWWGFTTGVVVLVIAVTGWVIYRFRETRCLTLAEFFERRYNRRFRIFAGSLAYLSGVINFGIFPAVEARFFIYFVGIPEHVAVLGLSVPTFPLTVAVLLAASLAFVFVGGQVAVIISDFLQGLFVNAVFIIISVFLLNLMRWDRIVAALSTAPADASLLNPFHTGNVHDFNFWYFLIGIIGVVYSTMSWQGTQGYNASARSAHEARMANVLYAWRMIPQTLVLLVIPAAAYTVLHHPDFAANAAGAGTALASVGSETLRNQLRVPVVLSGLLPPGLIGAFTAVMMAASLTTLAAYMHSWGSILVQDVLAPMRREPIPPEKHIRWLRTSIIGVAVFTLFFSVLFQQSQYIFLFFAVTGAIFAGGSGAVIIGGLYWKRGTTAAAFTAMILGAVISVGGIVIHQVSPGFPVNGQVFWAIAMGAATLGYVLVSLLGKGPAADLDRLRHRAAAENEGQPDGAGSGTGDAAAPPPAARGWRALGWGPDFSRGDRIIYVITYAWIFLWVAVFAVGTAINLTREVSDAAWARFWWIYVLIQLVVACVVFVWFAVGGTRDLVAMLRELRGMTRDATDDGFVRRKTP